MRNDSGEREGAGWGSEGAEQALQCERRLARLAAAPAGRSASPALSPQVVRQPPREQGEREVADPRTPAPTTTTDPNAGSLHATCRGPCKPQAAPTQSTQAVPGRSAAPGHRPWVRSSSQLSRGAWHRCRAEGRGTVTGRKAEQARERFTFARKAPPLAEGKEQLPG